MLKEKELSESQLLLKCKKGDKKSFEELLLKNKDRVEGWILSFTKKPEIVQEIFQLASIKAWRYVASFRGDCKFSSWMCNIARNCYYDFYRAQKRRPEISLDEILERQKEEGGVFEIKNSLVVEHSRSKDSDTRHYVDLINQNLDKLKPIHREPLRMFIEEGLEYSEIARALKCPVGTVMSRIFYARREAQKILKGLRDELSTS